MKTKVNHKAKIITISGKRINLTKQAALCRFFEKRGYTVVFRIQ